MKLSKKFKLEIKWAKCKQYELANKIGVHPATISLWQRNISVPGEDDKRILLLGKILKVKFASLIMQVITRNNVGNLGCKFQKQRYLEFATDFQRA